MLPGPFFAWPGAIFALMMPSAVGFVVLLACYFPLGASTDPSQILRGL